MNEKHAAVRMRDIARYISATIVILCAACYAVLIVSGKLPTERRLDAPSLGLIAMCAIFVLLLVTPRLLSDLKSFEFGKMKIDLDRVQKQQDEQQEEISFIKLVLPFLLPETLQELLSAIATRSNREFTCSHTLRSNLRKLAESGLVARRPGVSLHDELADDKQRFAGLHRLLVVTDFGRAWIEQIEALERERAR